MSSISFLKKVPGFRSGIWWKSLFAIVVYFFVGLIVLGLIIPAELTLALEDVKLTNKSSSSIQGKTEPSQEVSLLKDNQVIQSIKADSDGKFIFSLNDLNEGNYTYQVKVCKNDKENKCLTKITQVMVDKTPPSKPILAIPESLPDNDWDEITIEGVTEPESVVNLSYADLDLGEVQTDSEGNFSFSTKLAVGGHLLRVKSLDEASNESEVYTTTIDFNPIKTKAKVYRVVDGDTIKIDEGKKSVRYIGIDTPETVHPNKPVECMGKEASNKNKELVEGKEVILEKDVSETDKYGRLLRYVWLGDILINELLVQEGYAQSSSYPPDIRYQERFIDAEREAREGNKGLWGEACNEVDRTEEVKGTNTTSNSNTNTLAPTIAPQTTTKTVTTTSNSNTSSSGAYSCSCSKTCSQMSSCDEAYYQLNTCGCSKRDGDDDGVPCESICPGG